MQSKAEKNYSKEIFSQVNIGNKLLAKYSFTANKFNYIHWD